MVHARAKGERVDPRAPGWMPFLLVVAVLAAFGNGVGGAFVLDDIVRIVQNPTLEHFWPPPVLGSLASRPVLHFTLAVDHAVWGLDPWGYHVVNITIHALASLALFAVVRRTLAGPRIPPALAKRADALAFATALLWSLHPLQTQAVTYIVQRGESLASLFYLLTIYGLIRAAGSARSSMWSAAAIAACVLGMGTKEIVATAPIAALLYDRVFLASSWRETLRKRGPLHLALLATMVLPFVLVARVPGGESTGFIEGVAPISPTTYAITQCGVVAHYLQLAFWPAPLVIDYGWRATASIVDVWPQALLLLALLAATVWALFRRPAIGYAGAFFFLVLAPTSSVIPIADLAFQHRMYLPLAGIVVLVVLAADRLLDRGAESRLVRLGALAAAAVALGLLTARRNRDYASPLAIWSDTVEKRPQNQRAQFNLGYALELEQRFDESYEHYREAVRLAPDYPDARVNLGLALVRKGQVEEGMEHYRRALELKPDWPIVHYDLGLALKILGKREEALASLKESLRLQPLHADARNETGSLLFAMKRDAEAVAEFREAIRIRPDFAEAHYNLGLALHRLGQKQEAETRYREALRLKPAYPEACNNLGAVLFERGQVDEAVALFQKALELNPGYADAAKNLEYVEHKRKGGHGGG